MITSSSGSTAFKRTTITVERRYIPVFGESPCSHALRANLRLLHQPSDRVYQRVERDFGILVVDRSGI